MTCYKCKLEVLDLTVKKLQQPVHALHQIRLEKKHVADVLKRSTQDDKHLHASKADLKENLEARHKLESERTDLKHQSEVGKIQLQVSTKDLTIQNSLVKIKQLQVDIIELNSKSKQYDAITATGIKSLMG